MSVGGALSTRHPRIRSMTERQIRVVLSRNSIARIAFLHDDRVELMPVHYAWHGGGLVGRTALGTKYLSWHVGRDVVMEVEETLGPYDWRCVIARGPVSMLRSRGSDAQRHAYNDAVDAIRAVLPGAFTEYDPTPERCFVFRVDPTELTGREAATK